MACRDEREVQATEIERIATAAGYEVIETLTQRRREDRTYNLGPGKARELAERVRATDARVVVFGGRLTPGQHGDLRALLPADTRLLDRYRLVLEIFAAGAGDERARKQVELARLEYELPRVRQTTESAALSVASEKGSRVDDIESRITRLRRELAAIARDDEQRRASRREQGFALVTLAGYTNAGKTTLMRRLADELTVESDGHADRTETATEADQLFETLETATRRAEIAGRRTVVTDTVGLIDELPHELVESFSATLGEIDGSDLVVAVVDASAPADRFRRRAEVTVQTVTGGAIVPALNKVDLIDDATLADRRETFEAVAPASVGEPVAISARTGAGVDELCARIDAGLPSESVTVRVPNSGASQRFVSWCHDHGRTETDYEGESVRVRFTANPETVAEARRRAERLGE